jgi:adenine-specific DNA-methyltransferase
MKPEKRKIKNDGQIFTPAYLVNDMLDFCGYNGYVILNKHIMENSCGDGAFLCEIVRRYCRPFNRESLKEELETYVHGIEKDPLEYNKCIKNLDAVAAEYGLFGVKWDIICGDTLELSKKYYGKMDYVIGNPPYVRVHNLGEKYDLSKQFSFAADGMIDEYLVFFEIGLKMLSDYGKLCLITPSSFLRSNAGQNFRNYISNSRTLKAICDLEHFQPFNAATYTIISLFDKSERRKEIAYYKYNAPNNIEFRDKLSYSNAFINGKLYLASHDVLENIRDMEIYGKGAISVKNGFATLADDIFIGNFNTNRNIIPIIKSSTGKRASCIFPYKENGDPLPEFAVRDNKYIWEHLSANRGRLESRSIANKKEWYLFGRTQALRDVGKNKIAINQLVKDKNSLKINFAPAGCGVYGGLYILSPFDIKTIEKILRSDDFIEYVKSLRNYKSGGYYAYTSQDLERYLNYYLDKRNENEFRFIANG